MVEKTFGFTYQVLICVNYMPLAFGFLFSSNSNSNSSFKFYGFMVRKTELFAFNGKIKFHYVAPSLPRRKKTEQIISSIFVLFILKTFIPFYVQPFTFHVRIH